MRRLIPLFLAVCLLFGGCSKPQDDYIYTPNETTQPIVPSATTAPSTVPTEPSSVPTEPVTEPSTEPTEPEQPVEPAYRNPLNGEAMETLYTGRATAVVIGNTKDALPQYGISNADVIYEVETEGGITRLLAVFSDVLNAGTIGPVRSARTFFNSISASYDAPIIHCGGSVRGIVGYHDLYGSKISGWAHLDARYYEDKAGTYFFRDYDRYYGGINWEHCLFTDGEKLLTLMNTNGFRSGDPEGTDYGLQFSDNVTLSGATANTVNVNFKWDKVTTMTYNPETGLYEAAQYGQPHVDGLTGEIMRYKNVLVLYTSQTGKHDGYYVRSYYELIGSGTGHFACNGQIIPIKWSRASLNDPFVYTLEDGTPLTLGVGKSYVGIVGAANSTTYQ